MKKARGVFIVCGTGRKHVVLIILKNTISHSMDVKKPLGVFKLNYCNYVMCGSAKRLGGK